MTLQVAPAHYPCGPAAAGANLEVSPNIGWANALPDANATADFRIGDKSIKFSGPGYHDKVNKHTPFRPSQHPSRYPTSVSAYANVYLVKSELE